MILTSIVAIAELGPLVLREDNEETVITIGDRGEAPRDVLASTSTLVEFILAIRKGDVLRTIAARRCGGKVCYIRIIRDVINALKEMIKREILNGWRSSCFFFFFRIKANLPSLETPSFERGFHSLTCRIGQP